MTRARLGVLLIATVLVVAGALLLARRNEQPAIIDAVPLLGGFAVHSATSIRITAAAARPVVTLNRGREGWTVAERAGYPADAARVRALLDSLATLHSVERKTTSPAKHAVLGVEDPHGPDAQGLRIELGAGAAKRAIIVGRPATTLGTYVRLDGDAQSHAALPALDVPLEVPRWLERTLLDVPAAEVAAVEVTPASGASYRLRRAKRDDPHLQFDALPPGRSLYDPTIADPQAALLERFIIDDVHAPSADMEPVTSARFTTFDGLVLELGGRVTGDRCDLRLQVAINPDATAASIVKARELSALADGRRFVVAPHRCGALFKPRDEFLQ